GAPVEPKPFHPVVHAILLGGDKPLYMSAQITGGQGSSSEIGEEPTWSPPTKIAARYLAPYLEERDRVARSASCRLASRGCDLTVEQPLRIVIADDHAVVRLGLRQVH